MKNQLLAIKAIITLVIICSNINLFAQDYPLFNSKEPLQLSLVADVLSLIEDKSEEPVYAAALLINYLPDNEIRAFEIKVKARGNTRRLAGLCDFPPLKFNFKKSTVKNTVFEGQDKLKFVSQCQQNDEYKNYVLEEYLLYKTYNIVTKESYKVRLVNITIKDKKLRVPTIEMTGFLIEDDEILAKRTGSKSFEEIIYNQDTCDGVSVDRLALFQFMIGNTDWYINTKHNIDIFEDKRDGYFIPVPYDFDYAGVINTNYAIPSKQISITKVKQRFYKGSCRDIEAFIPTIVLFNEKMEEIYSLYHSFKYLPKYTINKSLRYYTKFYKIINSPEQIDSLLYEVCDSVSPINLRAKN